MAHCDCLLMCALEMLYSLTYLLTCITLRKQNRNNGNDVLTEHCDSVWYGMV